MKANEIKDMTVDELNSKLAELKQELFNLRFQHAVNQLENPKRLQAVKKDIARVKTFIRKQVQCSVIFEGRINCERREKFEKNQSWRCSFQQDG